jgi:hypothetical protein
MLLGWLRKFLFAAALALMPLHGIAATLTVLLCHGDAKTHAAHASSGASHDHGSHSDGAAQHQHEHGAAQSDDGSTTASSAFHLCCNLTASAPPSIVTTPAPAKFPIRAFAPDSLHDLFVPEQPQRPPLA